MADYDVVLLIEQRLTDQDARQVRSLHEGLDDPVSYHILLPLDDAADQVEASLGSLSGGELLASPGLPTDPEQLSELREVSQDRSETDLVASVAALEKAGGTTASSAVVTGQPVDELAAKVTAVDGREAIILTRPHVVAEFFHVDWSAQARRHLGVPVLHLLEHETFAGQAEGPDGISGA